MSPLSSSLAGGPEGVGSLPRHCYQAVALVEGAGSTARAILAHVLRCHDCTAQLFETLMRRDFPAPAGSESSSSHAQAIRRDALASWRDGDPNLVDIGLVEASEVFSESGEPEEAAVSKAYLALYYLEILPSSPTFSFLAYLCIETALPDLPASEDLLRLYLAIAEARCLALNKHVQRAEEVLRGLPLDPTPPGSDARARVAWFRARALGAAGELDEARRSLSEALEFFLGRSLPEALLAALDVVLLADSGSRPETVRSVLSLLQRTFSLPSDQARRLEALANAHSPAALSNAAARLQGEISSAVRFLDLFTGALDHG